MHQIRRWVIVDHLLAFGRSLAPSSSGRNEVMLSLCPQPLVAPAYFYHPGAEPNTWCAVRLSAAGSDSLAFPVIFAGVLACH
jgi:hypothetical protein